MEEWHGAYEAMVVVWLKELQYWLSVGPLLWSRFKYPNYWMDCHDIFYRYSRCPNDVFCILDPLILLLASTTNLNFLHFWNIPTSTGWILGSQTINCNYFGYPLNVVSSINKFFFICLIIWFMTTCPHVRDIHIGLSWN